MLGIHVAILDSWEDDSYMILIGENHDIQGLGS